MQSTKGSWGWLAWGDLSGADLACSHLQASNVSWAHDRVKDLKRGYIKNAGSFSTSAQALHEGQDETVKKTMTKHLGPHLFRRCEKVTSCTHEKVRLAKAPAAQPEFHF